MLQAVEDSILIVQFASPFLAILSVIVFEVPRYILSTLSMAAFGVRPIAVADAQTSISVIIPTFNGAHGLEKTVCSLRQQKAHLIEIIIIDDGSHDGTYETALELLRDGQIQCVLKHQLRAGKSAAINHAARFAKGDLLLILDSDTVIEGPLSLAILAASFSDPRVAAASGNIKAQNKDDSLWTSFQALEYLVSITAGRSFLNHLDSIACCSGAFSMFRRDVFLWVGGMNVGPGEDLEITLRLRALGYRVTFAGAALAATQVPSHFLKLMRQRLRWDRDAIAIRMMMKKQKNHFVSSDRLGDVLQRLDFSVFELFPTLFFPFYCLYVLYFFGPDAPAFFFGIYLYLLGLYSVNLVIVMMTIKAQLSWFDALVLLALPFYQGVLMKLVRLYAFVSEMMVQSSRDDDFVPPRIRHALYARRPSCA